MKSRHSARHWLVLGLAILAAAVLRSVEDFAADQGALWVWVDMVTGTGSVIVLVSVGYWWRTVEERP